MKILNRESYTILKTGLRKNIYFHVNLKKKNPQFSPLNPFKRLNSNWFVNLDQGSVHERLLEDIPTHYHLQLLRIFFLLISFALSIDHQKNNLWVQSLGGEGEMGLLRPTSHF
jgi:hypothetical protein